jgi:hypothetical protein
VALALRVRVAGGDTGHGSRRGWCPHQPEKKTRQLETRKYLKLLLTTKRLVMPCGKKRKRHKIATHKRKKRLRKNRHKKK